MYFTNFMSFVPAVPAVQAGSELRVGVKWTAVALVNVPIYGLLSGPFGSAPGFH